MEIEFAIKGNLQKKLQKALRKTGDLSSITKKIGAELARSTKTKTFKQQGQRVGSLSGFEFTKWADLKESTKRWRKRIGKASSPILNLHGASGLKGSITYEGKKFSTRWGPSEKAPYGKYNQFGTRYMTARPFIGFFKDDYDELVKYTREFLQRIFR